MKTINIPVLCKECSGEFFTKPHIIKIGKGIFCSRSCRQKWRMRKENRGPNHFEFPKGSKYSLLRKSFARSEECRRKMSEKAMGNKYGLGKKKSPEARKKLSQSLTGRRLSPEHVEKMRKIRTGSKHTPETILKIRAIRLKMRGPNCPAWRGGISKKNKSERQIAMESTEYKDWRFSVFKRDNYTCIFCGVHGVQLNADHIKPWSEFPELRYEISNGRTLCVPCHRKTPTYGNRKDLELTQQKDSAGQ